MGPTLVVHIAAGSLGILSGYVALSSGKGQTLHRRSGTVFVYTMLTMGMLGASLAAISGVWMPVNIPAGVITTYLVLSGFTSVKPFAKGGHAVHIAGMLVAGFIGVMCLTFGIEAAANGGKRDGIPAFPFFMFGAVGAIASVQDWLMLRRGQVLTGLTGTPRLRRHLWRMCFALFIAAMSFFIGQADVFPKPIRIRPLLAVPAFVPLLAMTWWLWRVRRKGVRSKGRVLVAEAA